MYNRDKDQANEVKLPAINNDEFKSWITAEADSEMIRFAENAAKYMGVKEVTTSQIRNIYGEIKRIQMNYSEERVAWLLLKPKVAYLAARNKKNEGLKFFKDIFNKAAEFVTNENTYNNFCNLMEALVAYHKVYEKKNKN